MSGMLRTALGVLLASTAAWTIYIQVEVMSELNFTIIAAANAFFFALLMLLAGLKGGCVSMSIVKKIALLVLEVATLPLINIDLYKKENNTYAYAHFLFLLPMTFDLIAQVFGEGSDDCNTDYFKDLCCVANVASLMYLAHLTDDKWQYYALAGTILLNKFIEYFGSIMFGMGELLKPMVYPVFFGLLASTLSEKAA